MARRAVKQERAEQTGASLVRAAAEVFSEQGFASASVARIADRAGVTLGALYFHFRNKEALAQEIVSRQPEFVAPPHTTRGLQHAVDVTLMWAAQLPRNPILQAGARLVWEQERFMTSKQNSHQQWIEILVEDLDAAQRRRELKAGVDAGTLARVVVNACTGAQMHSYVESAHADLLQRVEEFWTFLLPTVAVPSVAKKIELSDPSGRAA